MALNILVVDDSSVMRSIVIRTLRMSGLELNDILQAGNGQEALDVLGKNWVDLVLLDINMPVMNGMELIDSVRKIPELSDLPMIVVSTESSSTRIETLKQRGVGFVHKPFTPEMLRNSVIELTGVTLNETPSDGSF
jgi:two-component system, chemotaxis family, chemotaxis protein CheY